MYTVTHQRIAKNSPHYDIFVNGQKIGTAEKNSNRSFTLDGQTYRTMKDLKGTVSSLAAQGIFHEAAAKDVSRLAFDLEEMVRPTDCGK